MHNRLFAFGGAVAVAIAAAWLSSNPLTAQSAAAGAKPGTVARTVDGHPDLQGFFNVATITPVERPAGVGLVLTREQAAAMEVYEQQRQVKNDAPSRADRGAPPVGGDTSSTPRTYLEFLERAGGGVVGGYNNYWLAGGTQVIAVDGQKRSSLIVDPPNGRIPPMKAEARKRYAAFLAGAASPDAAEGGTAGPPGAFDGPEVRPLAERCLLGFLSTSGPPTLPNYFYNNLKQIVQTRDAVMILNEMVHDVRIIRIGGTHPPSNIRKWLGDSVGRWEGDTLVVDTTNFTDKTQFQGSGRDLHVLERFTRVDPKTIMYRFTIEDPSTWDTAWTGEYPWVGTDEPLYEYACHEGNYALGSILRGARLDEADPKKSR